MNKFWAVFSAIWLVAVLLQSRFLPEKIFPTVACPFPASLSPAGNRSSGRWPPAFHRPAHEYIARWWQWRRGPWDPDFIFDFFFPTEKKAAEIQKRLPAPQRGYRRSSFFYASILPQNGNQNLVEPLSRAMVCPVTKRDSSEAKKRTAGAMSVSGSPSLFIGWWATEAA